MKNYEVTFIVDPVLSADEIKSTAQTYQDMLKNEGCEIIAVNELGLKGLAYEIKKRSSGIYYVIEFSNKDGEIINKLELALRRDERIMRFLTVHLDKYGVKYNEDKRAGKIGSVKDRVKKEEKPTDVRDLRYTKAESTPKPTAAAPVTPAPAPEPVAVAEPVAAPEPVVVAEPAPAPEPVAVAEPVAAPEPVVVAEPVAAPEPVVVAEPVAAPETVVVAEPVATPEPVVVEPLAAEQEVAVESVSTTEPIAVAEPETTPEIKKEEE